MCAESVCIYISQFCFIQSARVSLTMLFCGVTSRIEGVVEMTLGVFPDWVLIKWWRPLKSVHSLFVEKEIPPICHVENGLCLIIFSSVLLCFHFSSVVVRQLQNVL